MEPNDRSPPPSNARPEVPDPEPSDPDAALYAAARARPHWTTKPAVRALIHELSEGLGPGEDLFFWDVHKRRAPRPSDAKEHALLWVPHASAPDKPRSGLEACRVHVTPDAEPVPSGLAETTLVSPGARKPPGGIASERGSERARPGALALLVVGLLVLSGVALGARLAAPRDTAPDASAPALSPLDAAPQVASPSAGARPSSSATASPRPRPPTPLTRPDF